MDSFYGGLPGAPFVLRKSFESESQMNEAFNRGEGYKEVFFGEYCIIDTPNKLDKTNGRIYRRNYTGADYIGQVVGPAGRAIQNLRKETFSVDKSNNTDSLNNVYVSKTIIDYLTSNSSNASLSNKNMEVTENLDEEGNFVSYSLTCRDTGANFGAIENLKENFQYYVYEVESTNSEYITCFLGIADEVSSLSVDDNGNVSYNHAAYNTVDGWENASVNGIRKIDFVDKYITENGETKKDTEKKDLYIWYSYNTDGATIDPANSWYKKYIGTVPFTTIEKVAEQKVEGIINGYSYALNTGANGASLGKVIERALCGEGGSYTNPSDNSIKKTVDTVESEVATLKTEKNKYSFTNENKVTGSLTTLIGKWA